MLKTSVERTVCCYVLKGMHLLFSDERIKWHLLKHVEMIQKQERLDIYAFCLTDDEAYFIAEGRCPKHIQQRLQDAAYQVFERPEFADWLCRGRKNCFAESVPEVLGSLAAIAERCRQIHRLPVQKGYVSRLNDYWWSSYNTYVGTFEWKFMNIHILLMYFSADYEEAVCRFRYFHRCHRKLSDCCSYEE